MVYVVAILVFIGIYIFGWFCGFSTGSLHGYNEALKDIGNIEELTKRAENSIKTLNTMRKDEDNE